MKNSLLFKAATTLFKIAPSIYKPLYYSFKKKQDANEINIMKQLIKPGSTVIDIGANIGFYAELFQKWVGENGTVHCFEPDAYNFKQIKINTKPYSNIICNQKAVSDKKGILTLYQSHRLNVDHRTYKPTEYDVSTEVETISIDEYMADKKVDFIKMDIQGAEYPAFIGMKNVLLNPDISVLSEFWPYGLKQAGSSKQEVFNYLKNAGFNIYALDKSGLRKIENESALRYFSDEEEEYYNIVITKKTI